MNSKIFLVFFLFFLFIPQVSYAICEGPIMPCGYDIDGDGTYELEYEYNEDNPNSGNLNWKDENEVFGTTWGDRNEGGYDWEGCEFHHIFILVSNILSYIMTCLAPIVGGIMFILGGFFFMIAGVDQGKLEAGKKIVTAAVVGLVIVFLSWVLLNTFLSSLGLAEWTGLQEGWWDFSY